MTSKTKPGSARVEQHYALPVDSLHGLLAHPLAEDLEPRQASLDGLTHCIVDPDDPLEFGLGFSFFADPENNVIKFIQKDKGFFATISS
jgi:hypothetical protein